MPQLTLKHCCIADVILDDNPKMGNKDKIVKINVDEEDFFEMLDHVKPENIIKYLDMRGIPHREAIKINVLRAELQIKKKVHRNMRNMMIINDKKIERAKRLMEQYYG